MSATLTDLTKVRAEYWADGPHSETPPGHWLLFGAAACRARGYSLAPIGVVNVRLPDTFGAMQVVIEP